MKLTKTGLILRSVLVVMVAFVVLVVFQIYQGIGAVKSARLKGLSVWSASNPEKEKIVEAFVSTCLDEKTVRDPEVPLPDLPAASIYECGEKYGSPELVAVLKTIDDGVVAPAPLRWL